MFWFIKLCIVLGLAAPVGLFAESGLVFDASTGTLTGQLDMNSGDVVKVSSVNFKPNVFITSATAAQRGGVYVSTHLFVAGISSATGYYGDGSTLTGVSTGTLKIGDSYGGGKVFWVDAQKRSALISATADQSGPMQLTPTTRITGANLDGVGAGKANTVMISTTTGPGTNAARLCQDYAVLGGDGVYYDDWYLPSMDELQLLCVQKTVVGGFSALYYWSSTEYTNPAQGMWVVDYAGCGSNFTDKTTTLSVRCVRGGPVSAFDYSRDAETVRDGAYLTSTQTFSGANTFKSITASSVTVPVISLAPGVSISSEASGALGWGGVLVSTNMYIVGFTSATRYYGDGSALASLPAARKDSLGVHIATKTLSLGSHSIISVSSVNFLSNVYLTSATAAQLGGVYVSTNLFVAGISSATSYYGDGSTLTGVSTVTLKIGDSYGGGIVFWVDDKRLSALVSATADQSAGISWAPVTNLLIGATLNGVGAGKANTVMISTTMGPGSYAARLCQDYAVLGADGVYYDDWYLPSSAELLLLYGQQTVVGGFTTGNYWSSSEVNSSIASVVWFPDSGSNTNAKSGSLDVRCIRGGPVSAFDYSRDAETVRDGAYLTSTQTFSGANTFKSITASSVTVPVLKLASVVEVSEAAAVLGGGVRVSTNMYIVGFASATKYYGDGSQLTAVALVPSIDVSTINATATTKYGGVNITTNVFVNGAAQLAMVVVSTQISTNHRLTSADFGKTITMNSASALTVTLPAVTAADIGATLTVVKLGTGKVAIHSGGGGLFVGDAATPYIHNSATIPPYASVTLFLASATRWLLTDGYGAWVTSIAAP